MRAVLPLCEAFAIILECSIKTGWCGERNDNTALVTRHYLMFPDVLQHFPSPPVWSVGDDGVMDVRLVHSRDGRHWSATNPASLGPLQGHLLKAAYN